MLKKPIIRKSNAQMARSLMVSRAAVCKWFNGRGKPTLNHMKALVFELNMPLDEVGLLFDTVIDPEVVNSFNLECEENGW